MHHMSSSVILPVYNGTKYLREQLDSLLWQTHVPDEVVCVDDGSSDGTPELVERYISEHGLENSWRLFRHERNLGWRESFFEAMRLTSGDVIFFCDQDDVWFPRKVERYVDVMFNSNRVNVLISPYQEWHGETVNELREISPAFELLDVSQTGGSFNIVSSGCTMAVRRSYYDRTCCYRVSGYAHDAFFRHISLIDGSLGRMKDSSILRRFHGNNASMKKRTLDSTIKTVEDDLAQCDSLARYIEAECLGGFAESAVLKERNWHLARLALLKRPSFVKAFSMAMRHDGMYESKRQLIGDVLLAMGWLRR